MTHNPDKLPSPGEGEEPSDRWPCGDFFGGRGSAMMTDGLCNHEECNPANRTELRKARGLE